MHTSQPDGLALDIQSKLPLGAGLGSSAAFNVAMVTSLLASHLCCHHPDHIAPVCKSESLRPTNLESINRWAFLGERLIHGQPSGIDNTISTLGGALAYTNGVVRPIPRYIGVRS